MTDLKPEVETALEWLVSLADSDREAAAAERRAATLRTALTDAQAQVAALTQRAEEAEERAKFYADTLRTAFTDVAGGDLGFNCPVCNEWTYLVPMMVNESEFDVECDNEDCAATVTICVNFTAKETR